MSEKPPAEEAPLESPQIVVTDEEIFEAHVGGKLSVELKAPLDTQRALSVAYTPGVAQVSRAIAADHTWPPAIPGRTGWWPSSATAARCSVSVTSAWRRRCR